MKKDATTFPRFHFLVAYLNGCIMEIWKDVPGYIGLYKVSNYGRVKSVKKQLVLKTCGSGNRYKIVALCNGMRKTFRVHRLVAAAFIPNPDNKPCIDHIDGDRANNHADNLRWVTYLENNNNPITKKRLSENNAKNMQGKEGVLHPNSKPVRMMKNGVCLKIYQSIHLAKKDGFNDTLIIRCCKGRMKKHKGYNWEYI